MRNIKLLFSCFVLLLAVLFFYKHNKHRYYINTISSYHEVSFPLNSIHKGTLVLFDVDDTLITSPALQTHHFSWWFKLLVILYNLPHITINWEKAYSTMWAQAPFTLTEPFVVDFINALQSQGATILALTSMESGPYGIIPSMPVWRYTMLKEMGIEFSKYYKDMIFNSLPLYRSYYPTLYKGILCTNQQDKGLVLNAFLKYIDTIPSQIIAFDDNVHALQSIGTTCETHGIPYILFRYRGKHKTQRQWNIRQSLQRFERWVLK